VAARGERLRAGLREALAGNAHVKEVRGQGLICGVQLDVVRPARTPWRCAAAYLRAFCDLRTVYHAQHR